MTSERKSERTRKVNSMTRQACLEKGMYLLEQASQALRRHFNNKAFLLEGSVVIGSPRVVGMEPSRPPSRFWAPERRAAWDAEYSRVFDAWVEQHINAKYREWQDKKAEGWKLIEDNATPEELWRIKRQYS